MPSCLGADTSVGGVGADKECIPKSLAEAD